MAIQEMKLADRVTRIRESLTMKFDGMVKESITRDKELGITGLSQRTIALAAGEPDFDPPLAALEAMALDLKTKGSNRYPPNKGKPGLLKAISTYIIKTRGLKYDAKTQVIANPGGKATCFFGLFAIVNPGDKVLIPRPYWTSYPDMVLLCDGEPVIIDWFELTNLEKIIAKQKIRALILNSPSNPSGQVLDQDLLADMARVLEQTDIWVISDEIYSPIVFPPAEHMSIAQFGNMQDQTLLVDGASKAFAMTGYRLGYGLGPEKLISAMAKLQGQITSAACGISQTGARAALEQSRLEVIKMSDAYQNRLRSIVLPWAKELGLEYVEPEGAFYFFFKIPGRNDCYNFCVELLEQQKVGLTPGEAFGMEGWARISYAASDEELIEALRRIKEFLNK